MYRIAASVLTMAVLPLGCAGPGPKLFPKAPIVERPCPDGMTEQAFDTDGDGRIDYMERASPDGTVVLMRYDDDGDGTFEFETPPPALAGRDLRHLIIILDSIPFELVRQAYEAGRFRHFHAPSRIISPFPVMTDLSLAEFFGTSPTPGVESQYYDGRRLNTGYGTYARETISQWHDRIDYHLPYRYHGFSYSRPEAWYGHELRSIGRGFAESKESVFLGYVVGTSALGAIRGYDGHIAGLERLDRFCHRVIQRNRGRVHITLLSDHGHSDVPAQRLDLRGALRDLGYRVQGKLNRPGDVIVPAFGIVTCAAVYTNEAGRVANDLSRVEGIGVAAYLNPSGEVVVANGEGRALISRSDDGYRYLIERGDPLRLKPVIRQLSQSGHVRMDGFVPDRVLFEATADHLFPDVLHRLWRASHGLIAHPPDVLLSIDDDYCFGSSLMFKLITLRGTHGNLNGLSSNGFVMSTAGRVDEVIRMEDLRAALGALGVPLE